MKNKGKRIRGRARYIVVCIAVFICFFVLSVMIKLLYKPSELRKYDVQWNEDIGMTYKDFSYGTQSSNTFDLYVPA